MPNLLDYIHETGDRSFRENPFSAPDSLALTQIVYMPMEGLLDGGGAATVRELWAFLARTYPEGLTDPFQRKRYFFTAACAAYDRLGDVTISRYVNHIDAQQETQFCACSSARRSARRPAKTPRNAKTGSSTARLSPVKPYPDTAPIDGKGG